MEYLKSFEEISEKIGIDNFVMPIIDPTIKSLLPNKLLNIIWLKEGEKNRPWEDSFYVPALLALFGWKAEFSRENSYNLIWENNCRKVPINILMSEKGFTQKWSSNQQKVVDEDAVLSSKIGVELANWITERTKFFFHPLKDHLEYCPEVYQSKERYSLKIKMIQV